MNPDPAQGPSGPPHAARVHPGRWVMAMTWEDLAFLHWPVDPARLRPHVPAPLALDTFDGRAYVAVVPFRMSGVRPRLVPPLPGLSAFPELNVRTYVTLDGVPGVFFFSLDAGSRPAVRAARRLYHLPYFDARMALRTDGDAIAYDSRRTHAGAPPAALRVRYAPTGGVFHAAPGTLDRFLTDRLSLYAADGRGRIFRADVQHPPWPLQPAAAEILENAMLAQIGLPPPVEPPLCHFARRLEVRAWWRARVWPR